MNSEHILDAIENVDAQFILAAAPRERSRKIDSRKMLTIFLATALTLLLVSCAVAAISEETLSRWFSDFDFDRYQERMMEEDVKYIGAMENYALVFYAGEGPSLVIYRYGTDGEQVFVEARGTGEYAISGGLSINHIEADGRHIYFGTITDTHWNPVDDTVTSLDWQTLCITDEEGNVFELDVSEKGGYICILDSEMSDFYAVDQSGAVCLTYSTFRSQGYPISECLLVEE